MSTDAGNDAALVGRLLDVIEGDILPLTEAGVRRGNKIFGAAILRKADRSLVLAETKQRDREPAVAKMIVARDYLARPNQWERRS